MAKKREHVVRVTQRAGKPSAVSSSEDVVALVRLGVPPQGHHHAG